MERKNFIAEKAKSPIALQLPMLAPIAAGTKKAPAKGLFEVRRKAGN